MSLSLPSLHHSEVQRAAYSVASAQDHRIIVAGPFFRELYKVAKISKTIILERSVALNLI